MLGAGRAQPGAVGIGPGVAPALALEQKIVKAVGLDADLVEALADAKKPRVPCLRRKHGARGFFSRRGGG